MLQERLPVSRSRQTTLQYPPKSIYNYREKTAVNFVYEYHFRDPTKMTPMDTKKAQFRIEHLTGAPRYGLTIM